MFRATLLIIRRSNCINTASGVVFSVSYRPVCRLRSSPSGVHVEKELLNLHTGRSLIENTIPETPDGHLQRILHQMLY